MHLSNIKKFCVAFFSVTVAATPSPIQNQANKVVLAKRATCTPTSGGIQSVDDTPAIHSAISTCGNGGTIVIPAGVTYYLRTTLDFTGCVGCTFNLEGTLKASDDTSYWNGKTAIILFNGIATCTFQSLTGSGVIDGNGQASYDLFATDSSYARATTVYIEGGSSHLTFKGFRIKNPPNVFFNMKGSSTNLQFASLTMTAASKSTNAAKNTDGFDVGATTYVTITDVTVSNDDDCVAFKSGANYVTVSGITCTGSHGLSVGSLGGSAGSTDTVKNIYVTDATMINSSKAVGIKLYPGGSSHGTATVSNVTYDGVTVTNCDYAAQIQSCYNEDASYCSSYPSTASVTGVYFKNFKGTTSTKYEPDIANIDCPGAGTCDVYFSGWSVKPPSGTATYLCANVDSSPGITCTSGASG
jgi:galacturan 1,4-alpha-galacturonidase